MQAKAKKQKLELARPPRAKGDVAWWDKYYTKATYINDRKLFAGAAAAQPGPRKEAPPKVIAAGQ